MGAAYHHLYAYGNCPIFLAVGQIEQHPVVEKGQIVIRNILPLRWTYDDRINDGSNAQLGMETFKTMLEHPEAYFGAINPPYTKPASNTHAC